MLLQRFLQNHVLANLTFMLILVMGALSYFSMPREQDPTINFNWIDITTVLPGASASDIEKRVTEPLEEAVRKVQDIKFVSSVSRESVSSILVRFEEIDERTFDKRINDLRREIQAKESELPEETNTSQILEITTANAFPTAILVVTAPENDDNLRYQSEIIKQGLEKVKGVDRVMHSALHFPELQVNFLPERLQALGISPTALADTVAAQFRDISAGSTRIGDQSWLVRFSGSSADPAKLAELPVLTAAGEVPLGSIAEVQRARDKAGRLVRLEGKPGVMLSITKKASSNTLELVESVNEYINERNALSNGTGVKITLVDDQTQVTREALSIMQNNMLLGLLLVLIVTWIFLGSRIAFLTSIGIPFILSGTFWALNIMDQTLNVSVLLGVVISLGMLVDDAVVVVESVYYRLQRGIAPLQACMESLREVAAPVTTAVLTTIAAFLPLMLLPGIIGKFMLIIPLVVSTALAISLLEAYWMLPAHILDFNVSFKKPSRVHRLRVNFIHWIRIRYTRILVKALRWAKTTLLITVLLFGFALYAVVGGLVKMDFFASDPIRLFYVNVEMPIGTPLEQTLAKVLEVEEKVRANVEEGEVRKMVSYSGLMFTETAPFFGDQYGQVVVSLKPKTPELRDVGEMIEAMRAEIEATVGPKRTFFLKLAGGPPTSKPISIKVRGDNMDEIHAAADALKAVMTTNPVISDITDDSELGQMELSLQINHDAAHRAGVDPGTIIRSLRLMVDGEVVASMQHQGRELEVRVKAKQRPLQDITELLRITLPTRDGGLIPLSELVKADYAPGPSSVRHYDYRRTITVEADINKKQTDEVKINAWIRAEWKTLQSQYPNIALDFSGLLDDINESLDSMAILFLFGIGLIYLILGTQFRSYFQPLMILSSVPMAFTGVALGLVITQNPLSLFTLYGVVALAGIAVNAAIVMISAANTRLEAGMSVLHATLYAARRRVIPILITSLTTVAGLFSLATGLGGHSLLWGPVATAIVWGLAFSTVLSLLVIPLLYRLSMGRSHILRERQQAQHGVMLKNGL